MTRIWFEGRWTGANAYIRAERSNRHQAATIKRDETNAAFYIAQNAHLEPITSPCTLHFTWHVKDRRRDIDNIGFGAKAIIDGMVRAGVFPDDRQKYIVRIIHDLVIDKNEGVWVELEEGE